MAYGILIVITLILFSTSLTSKRTFLYTVSGLLIVINIAYLTLWRDNLHCTQWTSFSIAFFDFEKHPEEIPSPTVYEPILGTIIRLTYGIVLLAICFLPTFLILKNIKGIKLKQLAIPLSILGIIATIAIYIPNSIIGERISAFVGVAGLINLTLLIVASAFYGLGAGLKRIKNVKTVPNTK